ncbi:bifunctional DNA primase/polymerase [Streptomyces sp. NPDC056341]|uniref:bifunctional DNA primase/polymerase n=1 Tax=Streptomyces sp. NPDC056341 TaxID=3345788 RepID=UPI0035D6B790
MSKHLTTALHLAASGTPVLPLRAGKVPFGNCRRCADNACGGRPNMKTPGPCTCPNPCHGWAAATIDPHVINSGSWRRAWQHASTVAYHPGGAGMTVVDLDDVDAIAWAREHLAATRTVPTTRGEHWIYRGAVTSVNGARPGVDVKSTMAYARWLGFGTGPMADLPDEVRALVDKPAPARPRPLPVPGAVSVPAGGGRCPHRSPVFLERGLVMAEQRISVATSGVHNAVYSAFLAVLSTHGRCGCLTEDHIARLFAAAQAKGESARHCATAWTNALITLGV